MRIVKYTILEDRNWLYEKYIVQKLSASQIASIVGCKSRQTVTNALRRHGITVRGKSPVPMSYSELQNKEWLYQRYMIQKLSCSQIAKELGCCHQIVYAALKTHNISLREIFPELKDSDWLYKKYVVEKLNCSEIGKQIGCDNETVSRALKRHDISIRNHSERTKGEMNPQYGKKLGKEHIKKLRAGNKKYWLNSEAHERQTERMIKLNQENPEMKKATLKLKSRTVPELRFLELCEKHNLPFKFTGDGSFWIENINPDFVDCNGKKIAVEVFGDYWHSPLLKPNIDWKRTYKGRKEILKKYGWKLIVLWETDLKRQDYEKFVLSVLEKEGITTFSETETQPLISEKKKSEVIELE